MTGFVSKRLMTRDRLNDEKETKEFPVMRFIFGMIFGIVIVTIGMEGVASLFDKGVHKVQETAREAVK
jgi:hypothetical protein